MGWRISSKRKINGKKVVAGYEYRINGRLKGAVYMQHDEKWIADSMGFDGLLGKGTLDETKKIIEDYSIMKNQGKEENFLCLPF